MIDECPVCGGPKKHAAVLPNGATINECRRGHKWHARPQGTEWTHKYQGPSLKDSDSGEGDTEGGADDGMEHAPPPS